MRFDRTAQQQMAADEYAQSLIREHGAPEALRIAENESERLWDMCADIADENRSGEKWVTLNREYGFASAVAAGVRAAKAEVR